LVTAVDRYELDSVSSGAELYAGIPTVLHQINTCVGQMAICTNGPQTYVERVVSAHNLRRFFDRVRYRRSSADTKVAMVRELLDQLSARPAIVVGDRRDDVEAAHQNGLRVVAVTYGYGSPDELKNADALAASPSELPGLVKSMLGTT
jgi:phosphoglycolate phosphatase